MLDYYKILNIAYAKEKGTLTDEMIRKNYEEKKAQYLKMQNKKTNGKVLNTSVNSTELEAYQNDEYLTLLEDAYRAINTENARKHYDELIYETKGINKQNNNFREYLKVDTKIDTKQLLAKIKKEASQKYPISKPEEILAKREREI